MTFDLELFAWVIGGAFTCWATGFAIGLIHRAVIQVADAAT